MMRHTNMWVMWLSALAVVVGCQDDRYSGFSDLDTKDTFAALSGRALNDAGTPQAGVEVYLSAPDGSMLRTRTDTDGVFRFESAPTGPQVLVLNNGRGVGGLLDVTVYSNGANTVGDVVLEALEASPQIVDVHGVGFEERVTREPGHLTLYHVTEDASRAYGFRREPASSRSGLVVVDMLNNSERTIAGALENPYGVSPWAAVLDDRILVYQRILAGEGDEQRIVFFDMLHEREAYTMPDQIRPSDYTALGELAFVLKRSGEAVVVDLNTREPRTIQLHAPSEEGDIGAYLWTSTPHGVVFQLYIPCPEEDAPCPSNPLRLLDPATMTTRVLLETDRQMSFHALPGMGALLGSRASDTRDAVDLFAVETRTGEVTPLTTLPCPEYCNVFLKELHPDGETLLVGVDSRYVTLNKETGQVRAVPHLLEIDGQTYDVCPLDSRYSWCSVQFRREMVEMVAVLDSRDQTPTPMTASLMRVVAEWPGGLEGDPVLWRDPLVDPLFIHTLGFVESEDGQTQFTLATDADTGFTQLHQRLPSGQLIQRTFLSAHHYTFHSPDHPNGVIYYQTRDPISGYDQLFRLNLDSLPDP